MSKRMLIDAAHPEETRVAVLNGREIEEFDFESLGKKQLRGNIYLAKVTRVEPSLQAAFVEYGGNRHGFLAFNEIHPDYFQIPHADREALLREAEADDDEEDDRPTAASDGDESDSLGGDDEDEIDEEVARRRRRLMRRYKIQEVIKRRQIMLIQVVKEERGNKGAALTTYLSLAGRYCVLMPNTDRGGGISRKITAATDRKRLRTVVSDLDVPQGMGLIVRTAGAKRTKAEIKRDYEYLSRMWTQIRDTTLHSIAPALIYEEEDLVKRSIRDLFDKDVDQIVVEGEAGYREAREFMRMLMPSQAKKIELHDGSAPLFVAHGIEDKLSQIYSPTVPLKSGGYLVINQTEALVAIDVNSGRATRERNIEATALKTNLEAAEEAARQLRLRDLAGLVVIDFIDMDEAKNNRAVEKVLKDCLARDRARIQMGRISGFGLMEISRQRRRSGILEGTTHVCPHCQGMGRVRSVESSALAALRAVELEAVRGGGEITLKAPLEVALYLLNQKREALSQLFALRGVHVGILVETALGEAAFEIERLSSEPAAITEARRAAVRPAVIADDLGDDLEEDEDEDVEDEVLPATEDDDDVEEDETPEDRSERGSRGEGDGGRRRNRRRRRGRRGDDVVRDRDDDPRETMPAPLDAEGEGEGGSRRRRRGRRGGRRSREEGGADVYAWSWPARLSGDDPYEWRGPSRRHLEAVAALETEPAGAPARPAIAEQEAPTLATQDPPMSTPATGSSTDEIWVELPASPEPEPAPRKPRRPRRVKASAPEPAAAQEDAAPATPSKTEPLAPELPPRESAEPSPAAEAPPPEAPPPEAHIVAREPDPAEISAPAAKPRRGWWRR